MTQSSPVSATALRLPGGAMWSGRLRRHQIMRLTTAGAGASVAALFYNADQPIERYNMPDTLKAQFTAFLSAGRVLLSDMGHVLCSLTADTCGWHDTISGHGDATDCRARFGEHSTTDDYQRRRNDRIRNTRDNFLVELGKHGLGLVDLMPNVNFFTKVVVGDDGRLTFMPGHAAAGATVELRAEMEVLVVLSNTPHPLDPATTYAPPAVELVIRNGPPPAIDDPCRCARAENGRAFQLTEALFA